MALVGANYLLASGYTPGQAAFIDVESSRQGFDVLASRGQGGRTELMTVRGGRNISPVGVDVLQRANISFKQVGGVGGNIVVFESGYRKTTLTEKEPRFVLPISRPGGEQISFNPVQKLKPGEPARGTFSYPEAPERKGEILVRPLSPVDVQRVVKNLQAGREFEFFRYGEEIKPKVSQIPKRQVSKPSVGFNLIFGKFKLPWWFR